ncbi:MAG: hypothetical protein JSR98_21025, partial [Proteobacteria bacterium]|nr:hypothetical protein [Pseudomonadota bacterium]
MLIRQTGSAIAPSYYVVFCAAVSLLVLCLPLNFNRDGQPGVQHAKAQ